MRSLLYKIMPADADAVPVRYDKTCDRCQSAGERAYHGWRASNQFSTRLRNDAIYPPPAIPAIFVARVNNMRAKAAKLQARARRTPPLFVSPRRPRCCPVLVMDAG